MKILEVLEDRVGKLIEMSVDLAKKNKVSEKEIGSLREELATQKDENTKFAERNADLLSQLKALESLSQEENKQQNEEKSLAKSVVDDLIKSIDALIERENEQ